MIQAHHQSSKSLPLNQALDFLDLIPDNLYHRLVTHSYRRSKFLSRAQSLQQRCLGLLNIRDCLYKGVSVTHDDLQKWLDNELAEELWLRITDKQLLANTRGNYSFTDSIILSVLDWLDNDSDNADINIKDSGEDSRQSAFEKSGTDSSEMLSQKTDPSSASVSPENNTPLNSTIDDLNNEYQQLKELNRQFAFERQLGWDLSKGLKSASDIRSLLKIHKIVKRSKMLRTVIQLIGRGKSRRMDEINKPGLNNLPIQGENIENNIPDDYSVNSVTGIFLGDDIARMLPSELLALTRPGLKMLWHARRAERKLLNYHFQGVLSGHLPQIQEQSLSHENKGNNIIEHKGPMILCLDTSASMQGNPELMARAVVLETLRVARMEKRKCYLYSFSGTDEISEIELDLEANGWRDVVDFIKTSFNGGTDINQVLLKASEKLADKKWKNADLMLVSDGRFKIKQTTVEYLRQYAAGTRVYGIQVSHWGTGAFNKICHHVFTLNNLRFLN